MKLYKAEECLNVLDQVFKKPQNDYEFVSSLCDTMQELEKQSAKYKKMRNSIIEEYFDLSKTEGNNCPIKDINNLPIVSKKFKEIENLEFKNELIKASRPEEISAKELYYLRDFFDFT